MVKELTASVLFWVVLIATFVVTLTLTNYVVELGVQIILSLQSII